MTASRLLALACATVLLTAPARAQLTLSQTAIGVTSADGTGGTLSLRASVGEPVVGTVTGGSLELCQGIGCVTPEAPEAFEVTNPVADDFFAWGDPIIVRWETLDPTITAADNVRISLICTGQAPVVRFASVPNTGARGFLMPASAGAHGGPADPGACRAEVALETDPALRGRSAPFATVDDADAVALTSPDRFSRYGLGDPFFWRWEPADLPAGSNARLSILCEGRPELVRFPSTANDGVQGILLPADFGAWDNCHGQVAAVADLAVFGRSPSVEILDVPLPSVEISAPVGGQLVTAGQATAIQWSTLSTDPTVSLRILLDDLSGPGVATVRLAQTDNDGSFTWSVPPSQAPGSQYRIRIAGFAGDGSRIVDVTELFVIQAPPAARAGRTLTEVPLERGWTRVVAPTATDAAEWLGSLLPAAGRVVARDDAGRILSLGADGSVGDLGALAAGAAIDVWVDAPASLGSAPRRAVRAREARRPAGTALTRPAALWTVQAPALADGDEVTVVRGRTVVGRGIVAGGAAAVVVAEAVADGAEVRGREDVGHEARAVRPPTRPPAALTLQVTRDEATEPLAVAAVEARSGAALPEAAALAFVPGADWTVTLANEAVAAKGADAPGEAGLEAAEVPSELSLPDVVPNPSRRDATVRIGLPETAPLRARVYDVRGRVVAVLADGAEVGAGWHEMVVPASRLAAGVYLVRVEAAGAIATRRFTVVR